MGDLGRVTATVLGDLFEWCGSNLIMELELLVVLVAACGSD